MDRTFHWKDILNIGHFIDRTFHGQNISFHREDFAFYGYDIS